MICVSFIECGIQTIFAQLNAQQKRLQHTPTKNLNACNQINLLKMSYDLTPPLFKKRKIGNIVMVKKVRFVDIMSICDICEYIQSFLSVQKIPNPIACESSYYNNHHIFRNKHLIENQYFTLRSLNQEFCQLQDTFVKCLFFFLGGDFLLLVF